MPSGEFVEEGEVALKLFAEGVEVTALRAIAAESGGQSLAREAALVHAVDMTKPAEAVDAQLVVDSADVESAAN